MARKNVSKKIVKKASSGNRNTSKKVVSDVKKNNNVQKSVVKDNVSKNNSVKTSGDSSLIWKIATAVLAVALVGMILFGNGSTNAVDLSSESVSKIDKSVLINASKNEKVLNPPPCM